MRGWTSQRVTPLARPRAHPYLPPAGPRGAPPPPPRRDDYGYGLGGPVGGFGHGRPEGASVRIELPIPQQFIPMIIGRGGSGIQRISQLTRTNITSPRRYAHAQHPLQRPRVCFSR